MSTTFTQRIDHLIDALGGDGKIEITDTVDQVYAGYIEFRELRHPHGGQTHALRDSGAAGPRQDEILQRLADGLITAEGSRLHETAIAISEDIDREYRLRCPVDYDVLRRSVHPVVTDGGAVVYDRPPEKGRQSQAELDALRRERRIP